MTAASRRTRSARPRQAFDQPAADRINDLDEHHRDGARRLPQRCHNRRAVADDHVRFERHQLRNLRRDAAGVSSAKAILDADIAGVRPSQFL